MTENCKKQKKKTFRQINLTCSNLAHSAGGERVLVIFTVIGFSLYIFSTSCNSCNRESCPLSAFVLCKTNYSFLRVRNIKARRFSTTTLSCTPQIINSLIWLIHANIPRPTANSINEAPCLSLFDAQLETPFI